jgi:hypothetical protein
LRDVRCWPRYSFESLLETSADAETQAHDEVEKEEHQQNQLNLHRSLTLVGLIALALGSLVFELNVGVVAISVAVLLALLAPGAQKKAIDQVSCYANLAEEILSPLSV